MTKSAKLSQPSRRLFLVLSVGAATALSGCQTGPLLDDSAGASLSAAGHLARIRSENGLGPLSSDAPLERMARHQAGYMARSGTMEHTTGWRRDFASRMKDDGVAAPAAENVAYGRMDLDRLFSMWMNSAGHRRNMLDPRFSRFGLASAGDGKPGGQRYWALVLGG